MIGIVVFAVIKLALHIWSDGLYGFHRDELQTLDDARHLAWGYIAYPPLTPFLGRVDLTLFGDTPRAFRVLAAVSQAVAIILSALIARHLGGGRKAQWIAALCVALSPISLATSALFQYVAFDFLWWVVACYFVARLIESDDPRWWIGIGAAIGLGALTKYTVAFFVAGLVVGVVATEFRRHLRSKWLWIGAAISIVIALPNFIWQATHGFVTLEFLRSIHARDIRWGRTKDFFVDQLKVATNLFTLPIWIAGLVVAIRAKRLRIFAWMFFVPFVLFVVAKGRGYYTAPLYPALFAAGALTAQRWKTALLVPLAVLAGIVIPFAVPMAPPGTRIFDITSNMNHDYREELGWPELVAEVARIHKNAPDAAILCANYGEAGAINRYGPQYGLPQAISGTNSFWARGYGNPPPQTVIVLGYSREWAERHFADVRAGGRIPSPWHLENEESQRPDIWICRGLKEPWPQFWKERRSFG